MKKILSALTALAIVILSVMAVSAMPVKGSITLELINKADKRALNNESVVFVKVADAEYTASGYSYTLLQDFQGTVNDLSSTEAADELLEKLSASSAEKTVLNSSADGKLCLSDCDIGVYLVYSEREIFNPFLVFVPTSTEDQYIFHLTAQPKIDLAAAPADPAPVDDETTEPPVNPDEEKTTVPSVGSDGEEVSRGGVQPTADPSDRGEELPHTGMLQYPIPVLCALGMLFFATGFVIYTDEKKKEN